MEFKRIYVYPRYPENLHKLFTLAYNIWSLWDNDAIKLFWRISSDLFPRMNKNPVLFLHSIPEEKLSELSRDQGFVYELEKVYEKYNEYCKLHSNSYAQLEGKKIAYFSMEYGLHQSIPIYAGGLGILAGDYLKGSSDLGIPIFGLGLFYRYGYFNQVIDINSLQEETYHKNNIYHLPIKELKNKKGESVCVSITILKKTVKVKVWIVNIGKIRLLLLDTNIEENPQEFRTITDHLYVADKDKRLMQEIVLGFAGIKALEASGIDPDIYHLNEGHSAFLIIERLKRLILGKGYSFEKAFVLIKSTSVFTTHTPVEAGNENFPVSMIKKYLADDIKSLEIEFEDFIKYGLLHNSDTFWLPSLAIRFSQYVNGVSKIHSEVSKSMWSSLFPRHSHIEVPITHITNGVHYSWLSHQMHNLIERYAGPVHMHLGENKEILNKIRDIPDEELWETHLKRKSEMISFVRNRLIRSLIEKGYSSVKINKASKVLNRNYLSIGFARRFAPYKRASLILRDKNRLKDILMNPERPVQILFAGKAHPADIKGKNIIKEIIDFAREYELEDHVVFIEDYDMNVAKYLVQGVDVWLNTPLKPMEASGTSGIKAGINGVLNMSIPDGWWPEVYNGKNGWAITAGKQYTNPDLRDMAEVNQIYDLLEEEITRLYYERDERDLPVKWIEMMKESIYTIATKFNVNRMINEYIGKFYIPALKTGEKLVENNEDQLNSVNERYNRLKNFWDKIYIKTLFSDADKKTVIISDDEINLECYVHIEDADMSLFDVEAFYFPEKEDCHYIEKLQFAEKYKDNTAKFTGTIKIKAAGIQYFNIRLVPSDEHIKRLHPELIKWLDL